MTTKKKTKKPKIAKAEKKKDERSVAEKMRDELRKYFNDESVASTFEGDGLSSVREVMPTRIDVIDKHIAGIGGFPYGRIVEISGQEDTGKSSLVNHLMWAAQQDGAIASLGDAERKVQPNWVDTFKVDRKNVLLLPCHTIEEYLESVILTIRKFGKRNKIAFFLDSTATSIPQKALDEDLTESEIPGAMAAAWSRGLRNLNQVMSDHLAMLVLVSQIRSKIGVLFGPTEEASGGRAIKHYSSLRLVVGHGKSVKDGTEHVGKWCSVRSIKNHLSVNHRGAKVLLNFQRGFDDGRSTLMYAKENRVVDPKCQSVKEARKCLGWEKDESEPDEIVSDVELKEAT